MTIAAVKEDRRTESHGAIMKLVEHRTDMLSAFSDLATHRPFAPSEELMQRIQRFCELLVDYTADAHFRLYRFVDNQQERRMSVSKIADLVYPRIASMTQNILDFNDKYDTSQHTRDQIASLEDDLSKLGECLADRIELEDRLIDVMTRSAAIQAGQAAARQAAQQASQ